MRAMERLRISDDEFVMHQRLSTMFIESSLELDSPGGEI